MDIKKHNNFYLVQNPRGDYGRDHKLYKGDNS
jgi:hypothetical protein